MATVNPKAPKVTSPAEKIDRAIADTAKGMPSRTSITTLSQEFVQAHRHDQGWQDWVEQQIVNVVHDRIRSHLLSQRASARADQKLVNWRDHTVGKTTVGKLDVPYCINERHEWSKLRDMNRDELLYVAGERRRFAEQQAFEARFFEALAKRIGKKKVGEVFSEEQIEQFEKAIRNDN